jgi:hypothetical protein
MKMSDEFCLTPGGIRFNAIKTRNNNPINSQNKKNIREKEI